MHERAGCGPEERVGAGGGRRQCNATPPRQGPLLSTRDPHQHMMLLLRHTRMHPTRFFLYLIRAQRATKKTQNTKKNAQGSPTARPPLRAPAAESRRRAHSRWAAVRVGLVRGAGPASLAARTGRRRAGLGRGATAFASVALMGMDGWIRGPAWGDTLLLTGTTLLLSFTPPAAPTPARAADPQAGSTRSRPPRSARRSCREIPP